VEYDEKLRVKTVTDKPFWSTFMNNDGAHIIASAKFENSKMLEGMDWSNHFIRPLI